MAVQRLLTMTSGNDFASILVSSVLLFSTHQTHRQCGTCLFGHARRRVSVNGEPPANPDRFTSCGSRPLQRASPQSSTNCIKKVGYEVIRTGRRHRPVRRWQLRRADPRERGYNSPAPMHQVRRSSSENRPRLDMWNWLLHEIGVRPTSGSGAYAFWSGFGSDI